MTQQNPKNKKIAIITNSGKGIGRLIAQKLASQGIIVVVNDDDIEAGLKTTEEIIISGDEASFMKEHINKLNEIELMMAKVFHKYGSIDILINNLYVGKNIQKNETPISYMGDILDVNIRSSFLCSQYALKYMREKNMEK